MCDDIGQYAQAIHPTRRSVLRTIGIGAAAAVVSVASPVAANAMTRSATVVDRSHGSRTRLVLLGTAGGPNWGGGGNRAGVSTAIVYDGRVYIVDLGVGSLRRLSESGLGPESGTLNPVRGVFFTHLHSDHTADWPTMYTTVHTNTFGRTDPDPIRVFGPGDRGTLPRVFPPSRPAPAVIAPDSPTPGIAELTRRLDEAFAQDLNDRARDSNFRAPSSQFRVEDIDLAGVWDVDPQGVPPRLAAPIDVWVDGDVTITATLVDHHPTAPAFAYRFDTPDGSVVVSGDTTVSQNLIDLARGADYLVHEVIDPAWVDQVVSPLPPEQAGPVRQHLLEAHTTIAQVGALVAQPAGVKNLVLSHLVPSTSADRVWKPASKGFSGKLTVGSDLLILPVRSRG